MPDPANPEQRHRIAGGRAGSGLGGMAGEPETGRPRDRERCGERVQIRIAQLVAGQVETDHPAAGGPRGRLRDRDIRLLVMMTQRRHDDPGRHAAATGAEPGTFAGRGNHRVHTESVANVSGRPESQLQVILAVSGGVLDGLGDDPGQRFGIGEERIAAGHLGQVHRQVRRSFQFQRASPASGRGWDSRSRRQLRRRLRTHPALQMGVQVEQQLPAAADHHRSSSKQVSSATSMLAIQPALSAGLMSP